MKEFNIHRVLFILLLSVTACSGPAKKTQLNSGELTISYDQNLHSRVSYEKARTPLVKDYQASEFLILNDQSIKNFKLTKQSKSSVNDKIGQGEKMELTGLYQDGNQSVQKKIITTVYNDISNFATTRVFYKNTGDQPLTVKGWVNNRYTLNAISKTDTTTNFWSFQTGSYPDRRDWVRPVKGGFNQQNYMGMNASDYGGGTPVADIWRPDAGLAVGHIEVTPQLISLPVSSDAKGDKATLEVAFEADSVSQEKFNQTLQPGDEIVTNTTFVYAHQRDYFKTLETYRQVLKSKGVPFNNPPETAYEPIWCAWGYQRNFTLQQVLKTLPKVKELGFKWVVLDDGWQRAEGDWRTNQKFNDMSMKQFVDKIHDSGLKAKLWWAPLAADPGSRTFENEPDMLLVNREGNHQKITWWNSYYLDPALSSTREYTQKLVQKFIGDWGFDGLKIDGQHLNQVPPDYGKSGTLEYPEKSVEELPEFYKMIYQTARNIQSDAVVEICPCGTSASSFIMPFMNQSVASDPLSSWQIRLKGKTYKALMGNNAAYYGDHVELSDNHSDFSSTVGVGGVIGTKFTWPKSSAPNSKYLLTADKEKMFKKWMNLYTQNMLPKGQYRGELYDIGFDKPEAHAIKKNGTMYYAFYADSWDGPVQLRGLQPGKRYQVIDYEHQKKIGEGEGSMVTVNAQFKDHLLLKAVSSEQ